MHPIRAPTRISDSIMMCNLSINNGRSCIVKTLEWQIRRRQKNNQMFWQYLHINKWVDKHRLNSKQMKDDKEQWRHHHPPLGANEEGIEPENGTRSPVKVEHQVQWTYPKMDSNLWLITSIIFQLILRLWATKLQKPRICRRVTYQIEHDRQRRSDILHN